MQTSPGCICLAHQDLSPTVPQPALTRTPNFKPSSFPHFLSCPQHFSPDDHIPGCPDHRWLQVLRPDAVPGGWHAVGLHQAGCHQRAHRLHQVQQSWPPTPCPPPVSHEVFCKDEDRPDGVSTPVQPNIWGFPNQICPVSAKQLGCACSKIHTSLWGPWPAVSWWFGWKQGGEGDVC